MAQPTSISLSQFTDTVQAAVKAAVQKHPKFRGDLPTQVAVSYLIRGIPVPEPIAAKVTVQETQDFAADLAAEIGAAGQQGIAGAVSGRLEGAIFSQGRHLIIGFPVSPDLLIEK